MAAELEEKTEDRGQKIEDRKKGRKEERERSGKTLFRLFRLWGVYARMDLIWVMRDMKMFLLWTTTDAVFNVAAVSGMLLLSERFSGIGAWSKWQFVFMLGYAATVSGIIDMFFGFNVAMISRRLGRGQLDHTLIQPQPIWLALLTDGFLPFSGFAPSLPGLVLLFWSWRHLPLFVTPGWLGLLLLNLLASTAIVVAFQFTWGSFAFWSPRGAEEINSSTLPLINQLKSFPLDGLSAGLSGSLLTVLPIGFVAWYPVRALLGLNPTPGAMFVTSFAALFFGLIAWAVFRQGLKHYERIGSQRYSSGGHRS